MKNICLVLMVILVVPMFIQSAFADELEDCNAGCGKEYSDCIALANNHVNDIEIQDAKVICDQKVTECNSGCTNKEQNKGLENPLQKQIEDESNPKTE
jgi:hypothetical protein